MLAVFENPPISSPNFHQSRFPCQPKERPADEKLWIAVAWRFDLNDIGGDVATQGGGSLLWVAGKRR